MKLISWNVNGIRACIKKGYLDFYSEADPDIMGIQETKIQRDQIAEELFKDYSYWNCAQKKGYSGTGVFSKIEPINVNLGIGREGYDDEGRVITAEYEGFFLVNVYTPNSKRELLRLSYRMDWEDEFLAYIMELDKEKPVIICGDLNVAHSEIDLKNPKSNEKNAGFTLEERNKLDTLLKSGFTDAFRYLYPLEEGRYTWWSYMRKARERNAGWRIDYFLVSNRLKKHIKDFKIHSDIFGSDHCPIELEIELD